MDSTLRCRRALSSSVFLRFNFLAAVDHVVSCGSVGVGATAGSPESAARQGCGSSGVKAARRCACQGFSQGNFAVVYDISENQLGSRSDSKR